MRNNELSDTILKLLDQLDVKKDIELINILNDKYAELNKSFLEISIDDIPDVYMRNCFNPLYNALRSFAYELDPLLGKVDCILDRTFDCKGCKLSIKKLSQQFGVEFQSFNENSDICKRCTARNYKLYDEKQRHLQIWDKIIREAITDEQIICRYIIFQIKSKLKYATSKQ